MCISTSLQLEQPLMPSSASVARARHVSAPASSSASSPMVSRTATLSLSWKSSKCRLLSRYPDHQRTFCRLRRSLEEGDLPFKTEQASLNSTPDEDHHHQQSPSTPSLPSCSVTTTTTSRSPVPDEEASPHAHDNAYDDANEDQVKSVKNCCLEIKMFNPSLPLKSLPGRIVVDESPPHRWPSDDPGGGRGGLAIKSSKGCHRRPSGLPSVLLRQELFLVLVSLSLLLTGFAQPVQGEICSSMIIKHNVNKFRNLTNCSIIEGHLIIASMNENELMNYTFPMLREVTDYVIFYQAQNIAKLDHIFPNLAVIRGNKLVMDFALVIYQMNRMAEIGLTGLTHILRGGVRVEKNRNLCYVNTVNWKRIVSPAYYQDIHIEENEMVNMCPLSCPKHCPSLGDFYGSKKAARNCWSSTTCQIDPNNLRIETTEASTISPGKCDDACIGGCTGETQLDCYACRDVMDVMSEQHEQKKNCISTCPDSLLLYENWRCISTEKCSEKKTRFNAETIGMERSYKNYKGKCLEHCPPDTEEEIIQSENISTCKKCDDCAKECPGQTIRSLETLKKFQGCTKIMGDLTIQITGKNIVDELGKNLDKVSVITGSLKISRSFPIVSLDFFKSLKEIQGAITPDTNLQTKTHYSLEILENENLQKLFPANSNVRITFRNGPDGDVSKGKAFIHYNQKLCRTEIKKLLRESQMYDPGDKSPDISYGTNGHKSVCSEKVLQLRIDNWAAGQGLQLNFDNYQKEIARSNPNADTRALLNYEIHYREIDRAHFEARNVTKFEGRDACGNDKWMIDDHWPTPANIQHDEYNGIVRDWPPETSIITDGIKPYSYYAIFVTTLIIREGIKGGEDIKSAASEIVYFHTPEDTPDPPQNIKVKDLTYSKVNITWQPPENPNGVITEYKVEVIHHQANTDRLINIRRYCDDDYQRPTADEINEKSKEPKPKPIDEQTGTCDCSTCAQGSEKKDQISKENEKVEEAQFLDHLLNLIYYIDFPTRKKRSISNMTNLININDVNENDDDIKFDYDDMSDEEIMNEERRMSSNVFSNQTDKLWIAIPDLKHYSKYTVMITACHRRESDGYQRCSKQQSLDFHTIKKEGADDIPGTILSNQDTNNGTDVWLSWEDPPDPNLVIVHYKIYITMQDALSQDEMSMCITAHDFLAMDRKYYPNFKGSFYASVSAVSLAGPGAKTAKLAVSINEKPSKLLLPILLPLIVALIIATGVGYMYFKKQRAMGDETTCNPIYLNRNFGNFEIPRDLIKVAQKLGTGSFGTVYGGVYTHDENGEVPCAIKEAKNDALREQLLDEAYLMRCIDTPHVVKLLGVVTEGFPQYVILELMDNGDLKNYLRKRRPNPPSPREVYQMAIQVADGMAYLSNVPEPKIIHRDLAARNCMVNGKLVVKIGDFGLARDLCYAQDYYRMHGKDWMPVRWMAPESLVDNVFSYASDVWAYGVVLWELVTLAQQPYQGMSNEEVLNFVKNGNTEKVPSGTPEIIANLMRDCWRFEASDRPTFIDICHRLLEHSHQEFQRDSFITSALCRRVVQQREGILASGDDDLPIDEAELAPLQQSNGNGEVRALDNGHAVQFPVLANPEDTGLRDFNNSQISPRAHNMWERLRKILRNRLPHSNTTTAASSAATSAAASATAVEA